MQVKYNDKSDSAGDPITEFTEFHCIASVNFVGT